MSTPKKIKSVIDLPAVNKEINAVLSQIKKLDKAVTKVNQNIAKMKQANKEKHK